MKWFALWPSVAQYFSKDERERGTSITISSLREMVLSLNFQSLFDGKSWGKRKRKKNRDWTKTFHQLLCEGDEYHYKKREQFPPQYLSLQRDPLHHWRSLIFRHKHTENKIFEKLERKRKRRSKNLQFIWIRLKRGERDTIVGTLIKSKDRGVSWWRRFKRSRDHCPIFPFSFQGCFIFTK